MVRHLEIAASEARRKTRNTYSDAGGGAMRMVSIEDNSELVTHFDGRPAVDKGSRNTRHALAIKATSPTTYTWTFFRAGKAVARGRNVLSADRQWFTEVSWGVTAPDRKMAFIYDRKK